jgi:hypothetical protein
LAKSLGFKTAFKPHLGCTFCIKGNMILFYQGNCNGQVLENRFMVCAIQEKGYASPIAKLMGAVISSIINIKAIQDQLPAALFQAQHRKAELHRIKAHTDIIFRIAPWIQNAFSSNGIENSILLP